MRTNVLTRYCFCGPAQAFPQQWMGLGCRDDLMSVIRSISYRSLARSRFQCSEARISRPAPAHPSLGYGIRQGKENTTPSRVLQHTAGTREFTRRSLGINLLNPFMELPPRE